MSTGKSPSRHHACQPQEGRRGGLVLAPSLLALALALAFSGREAHAQPAGGSALHGSFSTGTAGANTVITTTNGPNGRHSAINWQSFNVPGGTSTYFQQPGADSTSINRVLGSNPSEIFGRLGSNGRLVLVNPAGIAVGPGAVVDTAGFVASTLPLSESDAIGGLLRFSAVPGLTPGALSVAGRIVASQGDVVLVAPQVQVSPDAVIHAIDGAVILAAGQKTSITGRGLEGIAMEMQAPTDEAINFGTLEGGAVGIFAGTLRHSGMINADQIVQEGGRVVLKAAMLAEVSGSGTITARGSTGGSIDVFGSQVVVKDNALLDASGTQGGGSIRVGGDYQGKNAEVPNAQVTHFYGQSQLKADATDHGDGGRVIVWADDTTFSRGSISARGGANGGDGGFVEVSGKEVLDFHSFVDTRAPMGKTGMLLLDPSTINIEDVAASSPSNATPYNTGSFSGTVVLDVDLVDAGTTDITLLAHTLNVNADVKLTHPINMTLHADYGGSINVNKSITMDGGNLKFLSNYNTSSSDTPGSLHINAPVTATGAGSITTSEVGYINVNSAISSSSGRIYLEPVNASLDVTSAGSITSATGEIALQSWGISTSSNLNVHGKITTGGALTVTGGASGSNAVTIDGGVTAKSVSISTVKSITLADVNATGGDVTLATNLSSGVPTAGGLIQLSGAVQTAGHNFSATSSRILVGDGASITTAGSANGTLHLTGNDTSTSSASSAIMLGHGARLDAGHAQISLDGKTASTHHGVEIRDGVILSATGDAAGSSYNGVGVYIKGTSTNTGSGISIQCPQQPCQPVQAISKLTLDGTSTLGKGIDLDGVMVTRLADAPATTPFSVTATGSGSPYGIHVNNGGLDSAGAGSINLSSTSHQILLEGATVLRTMGGDINVSAGTGAALAADALILSGASLDAGTGKVTLTGRTSSATASGIVFRAGLPNAFAGTEVSINGSNTAATTSGSGAGVTIDSAELASLDGLNIAGTVNAGRAVQLANSTQGSILGAQGGPLKIDGVGGDVVMTGGKLSAPTGIKLTSAGMTQISGTELDSTAAGTIDIHGSKGVILEASGTKQAALKSTGGGILVVGGSSSLAGQHGIAVSSTKIDAGNGAVYLSGITADLAKAGVSVGSNVELTAKGTRTLSGQSVTGVRVEGIHNSNGTGVSVSCTASCTAITGDGLLTLGGQTQSGTGVAVNGATVRRSSEGDLQLVGTGVNGVSLSGKAALAASSQGDIGVDSTGLLQVNDASITSSHGAITLEGVSVGSMAVLLTGAKIDAGDGSLFVHGQANINSTAAIVLQTNNELSARGAEGARLVGDNPGAVGLGSGVYFQGPNAPVTLTGAGNLSISGLVTSGTAVLLNPATVSRSGATDSIEILGMGGQISLQAISSSAVSSVHAGGDVTLSAPSVSIGSGSSVSANQDVKLITDTLALSGHVNAARSAVIAPKSNARPIVVGATDSSKLAVTQAMLNLVDAPTVAIGSAQATGGLMLAGNVSLASGRTLSLIQGDGNIGKTSDAINLQVDALHLAGRDASLLGDNHVARLSARLEGKLRLSNEGDLAIRGDGEAGIVAASVELAAAGKLTQENDSAAIRTASLDATAGGYLLLSASGNDVAQASLASTSGNIELRNSRISTTGTQLTADAQVGSVRYRGVDALTVNSLTAGSTAAGHERDTAAVSLEAADIQLAGAAAVDGISVTAAGSVWLSATQGDIGALNAPVRLASAAYPRALELSAQATGGSVYLRSDTSLAVQSLSTQGGDAELEASTAGATLNLRNAAVGGQLRWRGFSGALFGEGAGTVSAAGAIQASSDVELLGNLMLGGPGGIATMSLGGNGLVVRNGGAIYFDLAGGAYDAISGGRAAFDTGSSVVATDSAANPASSGTKTLITGAMSGDLPVLQTSLDATLKFGTGASGPTDLLLAVTAVGPAPPPPAPPTPPAPPAPPAPPTPPGPPNPDNGGNGGNTEPGSSSWGTQPPVAFEKAFMRYASEDAVQPDASVDLKDCQGVSTDGLDDVLCPRAETMGMDDEPGDLDAQGASVQ